MNTKALVAIMVCGVLFATMFLVYGSYQNSVGYTSGYNKGFGAGQERTTGLAAQTSYFNGYQAGLKAQTINGTK